ncbi:hypothetical protein ZHAS_00007374 [Anopheles sinensis]|uniref:Uncharacterized protein n=1 Tax=Anopheles sinensis TaxID=74873 RepID=A0A084VPU2_ANOSI|nr:hypothetical protein ZHAS_00007374 [Anopheles sinensis]
MMPRRSFRCIFKRFLQQPHHHHHHIIMVMSSISASTAHQLYHLHMERQNFASLKSIRPRAKRHDSMMRHDARRRPTRAEAEEKKIVLGRAPNHHQPKVEPNTISGWTGTAGENGWWKAGKRSITNKQRFGRGREREFMQLIFHIVIITFG